MDDIKIQGYDLTSRTDKEGTMKLTLSVSPQDLAKASALLVAAVHEKGEDGSPALFDISFKVVGA